MAFEKPRTPTHSLQLLNATMRTDILRHLHELIRKGRRHQGKTSPLIILIRSIEDILEVFSDTRFFQCVGPNPFNTERPHHRFDQEQDARHDIDLLTFHLESLQQILAEIGENSSLFPDSVPLAEEQIRIAERIDDHTNRVFSEAEGSEKFLASMHEYTDDFKRLLDISTKEEMNELCERYDGFYRFAKCVEALAQGLSDGSIPRM